MIAVERALYVRKQETPFIWPPRGLQNDLSHLHYTFTIKVVSDLNSLFNSFILNMKYCNIAVGEYKTTIILIEYEITYDYS